MLSIGRTIGEALPVDLAHIRDVEYYDGPLLALFETSVGDPYLYYWCDRNSVVNRWLVFRTTKHHVVSYEMRKVSLLDVVKGARDQFYYAVDINGSRKVTQVALVMPPELPDAYLPRANSFYDGEVHNRSQSQEVIIKGDDWGFETAAEFPRKYIQSYAFIRAFPREGSTKQFRSSLNLTKGWVFHTLYDQMMANGGNHRPELAEIAVASPGYMRISVEDHVAEDLRVSVAEYLKHSSEVKPICNTLKDWSNGHEPLLPGVPNKLITRLGELLQFDSKAVLACVDSEEQAAKIVTSFFRRLKDLATFHSERTAVLVGLETDEVEDDND